MKTVSDRELADRGIAIFVLAAAGVMLALGLLHLAFADRQAGGVYWFDLDKERNLPTWVSGSLFFLFAAVATGAFHAERHVNRRGRPVFKWPSLWLGAAAVGIVLSADEIMILHENLFWREVREGSQQLGGAWLYVTQWQILYLPVFLLIFPFLIVFFLNRFASDQRSLRAALGGVACWLLALLIEALREPFKAAGPGYYQFSVLAEEELEMLGAALIVLAVLLYLRAILVRLDRKSLQEITQRGYLFRRSTIVALLAFIAFLTVAAGTIVAFTRQLQTRHVPLPALQRRVLESDH